MYFPGGKTMTRTKTQGFTLIEAAVAIAVVAILSGIIVPLVVKNLNDARVARARNDVQVIAAAIASQLKDTGTRPTAGLGAGLAIWGSAAPATQAPTNITGTAANTFVALFSGVSTNALQNMFGYPNGTLPTAEFASKGPYMANDIALKTDPWGRSYMILGYNATDQAIPTAPIWVVSGGPDHTVLVANATHNAATGYPAVWNQATVNAAGDSRDDIVVRVN
jgi:prepilin-type N-terminal cleavage/methylation domain-containing protein